MTYSPITVNFLALDVGIARPTISVASGRRIWISKRVGRRNVAIVRQTQNLAQQHVQRLRIQHTIVILLTDATAAVAHRHVQIPIGAESNLTGVVPPVREDGSFEEHLLGGRVDDAVPTEHKARKTIDRTLLGRTGRVATVVFVVGVIQVDVAVAVDAKAGVEGRTAETALDVGAELGDGQGLGFAGDAAVDGVKVLYDP